MAKHTLKILQCEHRSDNDHNVAKCNVIKIV